MRFDRLVDEVLPPPNWSTEMLIIGIAAGFVIGAICGALLAIIIT